MKIAIATNEKKTLSKTHFGDSECFIICEITSNGSSILKIVDNTFINVDESTTHGSNQKRNSVLSLFDEDINLIVASRKSPNFDKINKNTKVTPVISHIMPLQDIIKHIEANYDYFSNIKNQKAYHPENSFVTIKED